MTRWPAIALAIASICAAQGPNKSAEGEIGGAVRSATTGEVLTGVRVSLQLSGGSQQLSRVTTTGPEGDYLFENLPAGQYNLQFRKSGYQPLTGRAGRVVLPSGGKGRHASIQLRAGGAISGRVLDAEGEPVADAQIAVYVLLYEFGRRVVYQSGRARSDERGEYRIYDLRKGEYLVRVGPPQGRTPEAHFYADTAGSYYPGASAPSQALPVHVDWGQEVTDIDMELSDRSTYHIAGVAIDADTGGACHPCTVQIAQVDGPFMVTLPRTSRVTPEGVFLIRGLSAGTYKIMSWRRSQAGQRVLQISDQPSEDVVLMVGTGQPVAGHIVFDEKTDEQDSGSMTVALTPLGAPSSWPLPETDVNEDLTFVIKGAPAEDYRLEVFPLPPGAYLKAVRFGGQALSGPVIKVPEDYPLSGIEALIAFDGATVSGQVKSRGPGSDEQGAVVARVALVPKPNQSGYLEERLVRTGQGGQFQFAGVAPGNYRLFALPLDSRTQIGDPGVQQALRAYGRDVSLDPEANVTVQVPLAP